MKDNVAGLRKKAHMEKLALAIENKAFAAFKKGRLNTSVLDKIRNNARQKNVQVIMLKNTIAARAVGTLNKKLDTDKIINLLTEENIFLVGKNIIDILSVLGDLRKKYKIKIVFAADNNIIVNEEDLNSIGDIGNIDNLSGSFIMALKSITMKFIKILQFKIDQPA